MDYFRPSSSNFALDPIVDMTFSQICTRNTILAYDSPVKVTYFDVSGMSSNSLVKEKCTS